jgi:hypothetical protein
MLRAQFGDNEFVHLGGELFVRKGTNSRYGNERGGDTTCQDQS